MSESSGLFLGKCFCSLLCKRCEAWLALPKPLFLLQDTSCLRYILCGADMASAASGEHHGFSAKEGTEAQKHYDWHSWEHLDLWVLHQDEFGHWTWETKPKPDMIFTMVPWGLLLHTPREASAWTHQPVWGHLSSKPPSSRRRTESSRLAVALRESGQDRLHRTTMGWPSTGSVHWRQLTAVRGWKQPLCVISPQSLPRQIAATYYCYQTLSLVQVAEVNALNQKVFILPVTQGGSGGPKWC